MISGLGFQEIILICLLILMFFGSKELPHMVREVSKFIAKLRSYSDKIKEELDSVTRVTKSIPATVALSNDDEDVFTQKRKLRGRYIVKRDSLSEDERVKKSAEVFQKLKERKEYQEAQAVMVYSSIQSEVSTKTIIEDLLKDNKRVVLPFYRKAVRKLGVGAIKNLETDTEPGVLNILEPKREFRKNFFKSDLDLVIAPGIAFDPAGGRLGYGSSAYDKFIDELKDEIPIIGLAYELQVMNDDLPFDYHDIAMDFIITEESVRDFTI